MAYKSNFHFFLSICRCGHNSLWFQWDTVGLTELDLKRKFGFKSLSCAFNSGTQAKKNKTKQQLADMCFSYDDLQECKRLAQVKQAHLKPCLNHVHVNICSHSIGQTKSSQVQHQWCKEEYFSTGLGERRVNI